MNPPITLSQDRQARNKPPPPAHPSSGSGSSNTHPNAFGPSSSSNKGKGKGKAYAVTPAAAQPAAPRPQKTPDEQFEERERRDRAARVLGSREMLIWHAMANNEVCLSSLPPFLPSSVASVARFVRWGEGCGRLGGRYHRCGRGRGIWVA